MKSLKTLPVVLLLLLGATLGGCLTGQKDPRTAEPGEVLMVCEHGTAKSVMAAALFNQAAAERRLPFRAIARGVNPDPAVPAPIAAGLAQDGFSIEDFTPARFTAAEVAGASRVIAIGVRPAVFGAGAGVSIDTWSDVPPASTQYSAARDSLREHVDALLNELQQNRDR
jgi:protein-tyrosine-phosphatase